MNIEGGSHEISDPLRSYTVDDAPLGPFCHPLCDFEDESPYV
jgi:hypothetical protein